MATDKTYPSGLRRIGAGTAEDAHATYGFPTPDSIEAAIQQGIGVVDSVRDDLDALEPRITALETGTGETLITTATYTVE